MRYAILTVGGGGDLESCRLLLDSAQRFVSGDFRQYWIVQGRDAGRFRPLAGARSEVLTVPSIVPLGIRWRMTWAPETARTAILRLSAASAIEADAFLLASPGVVFVRPFDLASLEHNGRLRLYRAIGEARQFPHILWHRAAARLLGLPVTDYLGSNYAGELITWRKDALGPLRERIEQITGKPWPRALLAAGEFSDTILHGVFAEQFLPGRYQFEDAPISLDGWSHDLSTSAGVQRLLDDLGPGQSAVRIPTDSPVAMAHCRRAIGAALLNFSAHAGDRPSFPRPRIASSLAPGRTSATPHSGSTAAIPNGTPSA